MLLQQALSFGFERANQVSSALSASRKHTGNDRAVLEEDSLLRWVRRTKGLCAYLIEDSFPNMGLSLVSHLSVGYHGSTTPFFIQKGV